MRPSHWPIYQRPAYCRPDEFGRWLAAVRSVALGHVTIPPIIPYVHRMTMLRPESAMCQVCAVDHGPGMPHNADSLYYQTRFRLRYGRSATWADAVAHISPELRQIWRDAAEYIREGVWTEPPAGVPVVAELPDGLILCRYDSDRDGDCALCATRGGCEAFGGPFVGAPFRRATT